MLGSIINRCSLWLRLVAVGPRLGTSKPKPLAKPPVSWSTFVDEVSATADGLISGKDAINGTCVRRVGSGEWWVVGNG